MHSDKSSVCFIKLYKKKTGEYFSRSKPFCILCSQPFKSCFLVSKRQNTTTAEKINLRTEEIILTSERAFITFIFFCPFLGHSHSL